MKRYSRFFAVLLVVAMLLPGIVQSPVIAATNKEYVIVMDLNLKSKPDDTASPTAYVPEGESVKHIKTVNDWFELEYKGRKGYTHRGNVTSRENYDYTGKVDIHNVKLANPATNKDFVIVIDVNLRSGNDNKYKSVTLMTEGSKIKHLGTTANGWFRVDYKGQEGYIHRGDVTSVDNYNSTDKTIHNVKLDKTATNQQYVSIIDQNLRAGNDKQYKSIKLIKRGDTVKHMGTTVNGWFKVNYNGQLGYIYRGDLTSRANYDKLHGEAEEGDLEEEEVVGTDLEVHFIDVGQGDSVLIKQGNKSMLIDAGDNGYGTTVVNYLKANGIKKLDYVIGTHPHADHIGGMDDVINSFDIGKVIMPKVTHTSQTFEDVITAITNKGLKITTPIVGDKYSLESSNFTILAPSSDKYSNLNNYSVALRLEFRSNSFVFTGDAEVQAENEIINSGLNLKADVLKVGHHGSDTSTTEAFLNKVNPKYAVIQVGEVNRYNHPDSIVINRLKERNIKVYRNDLNGNIVATSDGKNIEFTTEASKPENDDKDDNQDNDQNIQVIRTKTGSKYHVAGCRTLRSEIPLTLKEAKRIGLEPCNVCNPPK